jgi:hypothetical protein
VVEEAYRRGFQHGVVAAEEIAHEDVAYLRSGSAGGLAGKLRYDKQPHNVGYIEAFLAGTGLGLRDPEWTEPRPPHEGGKEARYRAFATRYNLVPFPGNLYSPVFRVLVPGGVPSEFDHTKVWSREGQLVLTTEPYDVSEGDLKMMGSWAAVSGWTFNDLGSAASPHFPGRTRLLLFAFREGAANLPCSRCCTFHPVHASTVFADQDRCPSCPPHPVEQVVEGITDDVPEKLHAEEEEVRSLDNLIGYASSRRHGFWCWEHRGDDGLTFLVRQHAVQRLGLTKGDRVTINGDYYTFGGTYRRISMPPGWDIGVRGEFTAICVWPDYYGKKRRLQSPDNSFS